MKKLIGSFFAVVFVFAMVCLLPSGSGLIPTASAYQGDKIYENDFYFEELADGTMMCTSYHGTDSSVTVPKTANGKTVTTVGSFTFSNTAVESVVIPSTVTVIKDRAFDDCSKLKSVVIHGAVSTISSRAFARCSNLTSVTIPSTLKTIDAEAFISCKSLTSIVLPEGLITIGANAFTDCSALSSINIPSTVKDFGASAFSRTPWLEAKRAKYSSHFVIINSVLIDARTTELETVTIPGSVVAIAPGAIADNSYIKKVVIENGVKSIGEASLSWCNNLSSVSIPESVTYIGSRAFYSTPWLSSQQNKDPLVIVNGIVIDGDYCKGSVTIPSTVRSIADGAFDYNQDMTSVTIPGSVKSIGEDSFYECKSLKTVKLSAGLTSIGYNAFTNCGQLKTVNFPSTLKTIASKAFYQCVMLEKIELPDSVTAIGESAFMYCRSAKTLKLPNSAVTIGKDAFFECDKIESLTIPAKAVLSEGCFGLMRGVKTIVAEEGRTRFARLAFVSMESLETVKLPKSLKTIDPYLFASTGLKFIDIPKGVENIESFAFSCCKDLCTVKCHGVKSISENNVFDDCGDGTTIVCSRNSVEDAYARIYGLKVSYYEISTARIYGNNRYGTATKVAEKAYPKGCDTIVIAAGMNYADALAGVPLANALNAPILLSTPKGLDNTTMNRILDLQPVKAYILGGAGAVPESVQSQLYTLGVPNVIRVEGSNRYETAVAIANCIKSVKQAPASLFIASATAFPDALSASAAAAADGAAILYVNPNGKFDDATAAYLDTIKGKDMNIYVIGGTAVIPDTAVTKLKAYSSNIIRLAGANRYATCAAVNEQFVGKFTNNRVCVVTGKDFPDALTAGVYAAQSKSALILADQSLVMETKKFLINKCPMLITAVGGTGAVPNDLLSKMVSVVKSGW